MPIPTQSQIGGEQQTAQAIADSVSSQIRVTMPGIIQSFDPDAVTCTVLPAIKGTDTDSAGNLVSMDLPLLVDVPVVFPGAGDVFITFAVNPGDECELKFHDRCIDFFWQNGGVQEPVDGRMHDLSDATCYVGQISQPNRIKNISNTSSQFRSADGSTYFEINPATQTINIAAPGGFNVTAPLSTFSAAVTVKGLLTWMGGMVGSIASGTAATITGAIKFIGTLTSNGKDISDQHTHGGVQTGSGNTNKVN